MLKMDVCSAAKLVAFMVCMEVVCCKLPSEQVSGMRFVFDINHNDTGRLNNVPKNKVISFPPAKYQDPCLREAVYCNPDCKLPSQQVSAITSVFDIIQNDSGRSFVRDYAPKTEVLNFVWTKNSNPCLWSGVYCNPDYSSIINVSFTFFQFQISTSEFLPFLCNITTLESVDVSSNHLGSIPDGFLSDCGNIKHLDFSWNRLDGPLPSLNGFKMLEYLDFNGNSLSGEISVELDGLVSLKFLNLSENQFRGRIPRNVAKLNVLEELVLYYNSFTGSIPGELGELTRLHTLDLSSNQLSGAIPTWISNITTLRVFRASSNQLNGSIPSGITSHLSSLSLVGNKLTGRIPSDLLSAPYLESLYLSDNELEGPIPAINSTRLSRLELLYNDLNGTIPWDSLGTLEYLFLSYNRLTGTLPPVLGNLTNLQSLFLDGNDFVGAIPPEISHLNLLEDLLISSNSLNGSIPYSISMMHNIFYLDLEGNNLQGPIPDSIGNLSSLEYLRLGDNQLSGPIPDSIRYLSYLTELQLGNNRLSGRIPDMPESLWNALNLSFNLFHGNIPITLSRLKRLEVLDLQANNLNGPIPHYIRNLSSLIQLELGNNQLTGPIPHVPETLQTALNLSYNRFDGPIPDVLSNLWQLGVLDLSNNRFSGQIPDFLTHFSGLNHLLLMNNNLSGVVPSFRNDVQVDTWGNPNLIDPRQNPSPALPHRKKKSIHPHFFIAAATGFPVGLLISIIAIFVSRRYHRVHGILSTPNTIHKPIIHFNKAMQAVSDPSNITVKATFSTFYKAVMPSGTTYLIKKFNHTNKIFQFPRYKELVEELEVLGELSNPNVMIPVAYLLTTRKAYLFYEFVRGTLYDILHHRMGCRLDWPSRFTIAVGVSKGLAFLHECTCGPIILLDLCSKSILLKSMDVPQISDIELCSLMHSSKTKECMAALDASSVGYVPPEYGSTKRVTAAGNVYSFGVVLLELVTGKPAVSEGSELAEWVLSISEQGNRWDEILDSSVSETSVGVRNQMVAVVKVALACINISPEMRPNSVTVLQMLQNRH